MASRYAPELPLQGTVVCAPPAPASRPSAYPGMNHQQVVYVALPDAFATVARYFGR